MFRAKLENSASSRRPEALAHQLPRDSERGRRRARAEPKETKGAEVEEKEDGKKWGEEKEEKYPHRGARPREHTLARRRVRARRRAHFLFKVYRGDVVRDKQILLIVTPV